MGGGCEYGGRIVYTISHKLCEWNIKRITSLFKQIKHKFGFFEFAECQDVDDEEDDDDDDDDDDGKFGYESELSRDSK